MNRILFSVLTILTEVSMAVANEPADSSRVVDLDEVVVVAQPKEQVRLRQQPVSSTLMGSQQMGRLTVRDLGDLSQYVPSFVMPKYGARLTSAVYTRGIGSRVNSPAVGVYYDNIPLLSKAAFNHHFYTLDRVDVLRGPQGTLYGQNTEGGLVRIFSKSPMNYQGTDLRLSLGNGLWRNVELAHHQHPNELTAFTVAAFYSGQRGFIDNKNFDQKNDRSLEAGGKLRLIYTPTKRLTLDWTTDYQWVSQNGFGYGQLFPFDLIDDEATIPANNTPTAPATTIMNSYKRQMVCTGLTAQAPIGGTPLCSPLLLTSTTSYQHLSDLMIMDQDYMTPDYLQLEQRQRHNAVTQELTLRSRQPGRWQHTTGAFAAYQWLRTQAPVYFGDAITGPISKAVTTAMQTAMQQSIYTSMLQQMLQQGMPQQAAEAAAQRGAQAAVEKAGISMHAEMAVPETFQTPQFNFGVFHESNVMLTDCLKLTLGLRLNYDWMKIEYDALAYMNMTGGTAERQATYHLTSHASDSRSRHDTQLLPKVALTYCLGQNTGNLYALFSKGYRAGGYNIQMFSDILQTDLTANQQKAMRGDYDVPHTTDDYEAIDQTISYKPEESWNFEVGSHLNLLDSRIHLDMAFYYMAIRNQQLSAMVPGSNYGRLMTNAGRSHSCGAEVNLRGSAYANRLDWMVGYGYTHSQFDEYVTSLNTTYDVPVDYSGKSVPFIPQHTFSATADYHTGRFTIGANICGQGRTWWDEANTIDQHVYAMLGAHADCCLGSVTLRLWGRNLTDTRYNTFAVASNATGFTAYFAQQGTPLQVGIDVDIHL